MSRKPSDQEATSLNLLSRKRHRSGSKSGQSGNESVSSADACDELENSAFYSFDIKDTSHIEEDGGAFLFEDVSAFLGPPYSSAFDPRPLTVKAGESVQ